MRCWLRFRAEHFCNCAFDLTDGVFGCTFFNNLYSIIIGTSALLRARRLSSGLIFCSFCLKECIFQPTEVHEVAKRVVEALTTTQVLGKVLTPDEAAILRRYFNRKIPLSEKVTVYLLIKLQLCALHIVSGVCFKNFWQCSARIRKMPCFFIHFFGILLQQMTAVEGAGNIGHSFG